MFLIGRMITPSVRYRQRSTRIVHSFANWIHGKIEERMCAWADETINPPFRIGGLMVHECAQRQ
jgi:hypothetical protein